MYSFNIEKFSEKLLKEMLPIVEESKKEVYLTKNVKKIGENVDIDTNLFLFLEEQGNLIVFTLRKNDKLIGYYILFKHNHRHAKNVIVANCENIHILKQYRNGNLSKDFISNCEKELKRMNVNLIQFGINTNMKAMNRFLKMNGFKEDEIIYIKELQ